MRRSQRVDVDRVVEDLVTSLRLDVDARGLARPLLDAFETKPDEHRADRGELGGAAVGTGTASATTS